MDVCETILKDEFYQHFLKEGGPDNAFPGKNLTFAEQIEKLSAGLEIISKELKTQVKQHHDSLLQQATHATQLSKSLSHINGLVQFLQEGGERLKLQVAQPYNQLEDQVRTLSNMHSVAHLLRLVQLFLTLHAKLKATSNLAEQATVLAELEPLLDHAELKRIDFLNEEKTEILTARQRLIHRVTRDLDAALRGTSASGDIERVTECLQIFANLRQLGTTLSGMLESMDKELRQSIKATLSGADVKATASQRGKTTTTAKAKTDATPSFKVKLWTAIEWLFGEEIADQCQKVIRLHRAIGAVRQSSETAIVVADEFQREFWRGVQTAMKKMFEETTPQVKQHLQQGLPKLLAAAKGLELRMNAEFEFDRGVFAFLETGYLEKCAANLKAPLLSVDYPIQETVDALIRNASAELNTAMIDDSLCLLVAGVLDSCNKDFWTKIEAQIKLGADSKQVFDAPNTAQVQNREHANTIYYHQVSTRRMVKELGTKFATSEAATKILDKLHEGQTLILAILQQLIDSMNSAVSIILLSMHREPGLSANVVPTGPSLFLKELQSFLERNWNSHIAVFNDKESVDGCGRELAKNCIDLFINNVAILRPLSTAGRQRIRSDCQHLETALRPIAGADLSVLGRQFRLLRALGHLIVLSPEAVIENTAEDGIVPAYIILFLLFGHAQQSDLASPHQAAEWSNEKLLQWLDGHTSERERLELVSGALQKYRNVIRKKNITQYDPVYPFILSYLEKATKNL